MKMFTDMPESDPRKLGINMEDENFLVGGKQLHELRVVDLKKECDRNKLPKNGTKRELIERLKAVGILSTRIEIDSDYFFQNEKVVSLCCGTFHYDRAHGTTLMVCYRKPNHLHCSYC